jgi:hypothetical protein
LIQAAEICYTQLNLLLLAIEARKYEGGEILINPRDKIINANAIGEWDASFDSRLSLKFFSQLKAEQQCRWRFSSMLSLWKRKEKDNI